MSKYRAGGCVAPPLPTPGVTPDRGSSYGTQDVYAPLRTEVESQRDYGQHNQRTTSGGRNVTDKHWGK